MKIFSEIESGLENQKPIIDASLISLESVKATMDVGGVKQGDTFATLADFFQAIITPYAPCEITSITGGTSYERGVGNKTATVTVTYTVKSDPVTEFKINGVAQTIPTKSGSAQMTITVNTDSDDWKSKSVSATIKDAKMTSASSKSTLFSTAGYMKVFFSQKSALTKDDVAALDEMTASSTLVKRAFSTSSVTISNAANSQYLYVIVPSTQSINVYDSMGTDVAMENPINIADVPCHGKTITENYKIYRAKNTSNAGNNIVFKFVK